MKEVYQEEEPYQGTGFFRCIPFDTQLNSDAEETNLSCRHSRLHFGYPVKAPCIMVIMPHRPHVEQSHPAPHSSVAFHSLRNWYLFSVPSGPCFRTTLDRRKSPALRTSSSSFAVHTPSMFSGSLPVRIVRGRMLSARTGSNVVAFKADSTSSMSTPLDTCASTQASSHSASASRASTLSLASAVGGSVSW